MATPLQYQALSEGFKSGVEGVNLPTQERARTQTLSEQAQQAQMKTAEMRDEYTTKMASRAAFTKAQMDNVEIDSSTNQGQMQLYKAAAANADNPESKAGFLDKLNTLQEKETKNNVERSKLNVSQMEEVSLGVNQVLLDPSIGGTTFKSLATSVKNPNTVAVLNNLAAVYEGRAPVPVQFTKGIPKKLQDLTPEESNAFKTGIREAFPGTKVERTAHNIATEGQARLETVRKKQKDAEDAAYDAQKLALTREAKALQGERTSLQKENLLLKLSKALAEFPAEIEDPAYSFMNKVPFKEKKMIPNPDPNYRELLALQEAVKAGKVKPTAGTLTPKEEDALAWATANPTDPRAISIKQKLGK